MTTPDFHKFFEYRDNGTLVWRVSRQGGKAQAGQVAGYSRPDGYALVGVCGKRWLVHRVVYAMWHGKMPEVIDHIDGDPSNNRIENLREATNSKNQHNRKIDPRNKLGVKNVQWHARDKIYAVRMKINGRVRSIGYDKDLEFAELLATMAREKYFGDFARHQ